MTVNHYCFVAERGFVALDSPRMRRRHVRGSQVYLSPSKLAKAEYVKTKTPFNSCKKKIKLSRRGPRSSKFSEFGHFTLLFAENGKNVQWWQTKEGRDA